MALPAGCDDSRFTTSTVASSRAAGAAVRRQKGVEMVKRLLTIAALYLGALGIALLVVPVQFGVDAVPDDASPELVALLRLLGGPFVGIAVLDWMSRSTEAAHPMLKPVLVANFVGFGVVALNDIVGVVTGDARDLAKLFLIVHVTFAAAFAVAWLRPVRTMSGS
jgi:hypothetical protein